MSAAGIIRYLRTNALPESVVFDQEQWKLQFALLASPEVIEKIRSPEIAPNIVRVKQAGVTRRPDEISGGAFEIMLDLPSTYFETLDALIKTHPAGTDGECILFHEEKLNLYLEAVRFAKLLKEVGHHAKSDRAFFYNPKEVLIKFEYTSKDLRHLPNLKNLESDLAKFEIESENAQIQKVSEVRKTLFIQELAGMAGEVDESRRFSFLLDRFESLLYRYHQAFNLFLVSISAKKLEDDFEEKRASVINSINSVLSGMQTSLISLPIAAMLAFANFEIGAGFSLKNVVIVCSLSIVAVLLFIFGASQWKSLCGLEAHHNNIADKLNAIGSVNQRVSTALKATDEHIKFVKDCIKIVSIVVCCFLVILWIIAYIFL